MTKKIIILVLIPSLFIYLTGCYSMLDISKEDLKTSPSSKLLVTTDSGAAYMFLNNSYHIQHDTIYGNIFNDNQTLLKKTIPLKDIANLQTEKLNAGLTVLIILGTVAFLVILGTQIFANSVETAFGR